MEENLFHVYFLYFPKNQNEQQSLRTKKPSNPLSSFAFPIYPILSFTNHNTLFTPLTRQIERILDRIPAETEYNLFFSFRFSTLFWILAPKSEKDREKEAKNRPRSLSRFPGHRFWRLGIVEGPRGEGDARQGEGEGDYARRTRYTREGVF